MTLERLMQEIYGECIFLERKLVSEFSSDQQIVFVESDSI